MGRCSLVPFPGAGLGLHHGIIHLGIGFDLANKSAGPRSRRLNCYSALPEQHTCRHVVDQGGSIFQAPATTPGRLLHSENELRRVRRGVDPLVGRAANFQKLLKVPSP